MGARVWENRILVARRNQNGLARVAPATALGAERLHGGTVVLFVGGDENSHSGLKNGADSTILRPEMEFIPRFFVAGLSQDDPESRRLLLDRGRDRLLRNGILCQPWEEFLLALRPGAPILA